LLGKKFRYYVDPVKRRWFERVEFRRACAMATNRQVMVDNVLYGQGIAAEGAEYVSNVRWYNPDIPKYPFDLKRAGELLDSIGFIDRDGDGIREDERGNPIRFTIISNKENRVREKIGVLLKEDLGKIGLEVTLRMLDFVDIVTRTGDTWDYEACILGLISGVPPHPAQSANTWLSAGRMHLWHPRASRPFRPWEAELDRLFESMKSEFTHEGQKDIFDRMQVIWAEQQCVIDLVTLQLHVAASNRIGNLKPAVVRTYLTHNIEELYFKER
jgi:peptide/nickel transport system substrate-binding protein